MSQRGLAALKQWRAFATTLTLNVSGNRTTWEQYVQGSGYIDEERIIQPTVFPAFAYQCLGWTLQVNLAPEESGTEGKPDFTPADSVTHPFVFETKSTKKGKELVGDEPQIHRYLTEGAPRIKTVLLTNLVGARVLVLDNNGMVHEKYNVDLRALLNGPVESVAKTSQAERLADLFEEFSRKELTPDEKIAKVRSAPPWNPMVEITSSDWILGRIDRIVALLTGNVLAQIETGAIQDHARTSADERKWITDELRQLATRLGESADKTTLQEFIEASESTPHGKALQQFAAHVAYYAATRLMLVRVWEDLELLDPMLYDGGFDKQMTRFDDVLIDVVGHSFTRAKDRYRSLFDQRNSYTWYEPDVLTYTDVIYELANTYLGAIQSDVLGQVYERMLERVDRKLLGVYYTPRDIIDLIWDLIGFDQVADEAEAQDREPRVLDVATGSGGFLVAGALRLRQRVQQQIDSGANITIQDWINSAADGLNGIELNRFSAYLAELNLLVQFGQVIASDKSLRLPPMSILSGDTLSLHNPDTLMSDWEEAVLPRDLIVDNKDRRDRARRIKVASQADFLMDVACGNPPYIGEKSAAGLMARTRRDYPYWESFVGQHMDYLYWFLILGVSKVRAGGRFGFITTEYWLHAEGAKPLRKYLAKRCHVDRIVLFRDFRLFPDAPGQHSMIITGTRVVKDDASLTAFPNLGAHKPRVSIYDGGPVSDAARARLLKAVREGKSNANVRTFNGGRSPNRLGEASWGEVVLTQAQLRQREHLTVGEQIRLDASEGVITTANNLTAKTENLLNGKDLSAVGGPGSRAGIQLLTAGEVKALGKLTKAEEDAVRRIVNTKDVYPYAAVVTDAAQRVLYLPKPGDIDSDLTDEQVRTTTPLPDDMPAVAAHLTHFRSLLEEKARGWGERRPWWTVHRARADIVGDAGLTTSGWANYCLISRWGAGGRITVGRAPSRTSPASGLHVLRAHDDVVPAAYLAALYNSTLYQEIAKTLPPGQLRKAELRRIGVPLRAEYVDTLVDAAGTLAHLVTDLVRSHSLRFPLLTESLRDNVALTDTTSQVWQPAPGPKTLWGSLSHVTWVDHLARHRSAATPLGEVRVEENLLGHQVGVTVRGSDRPAAVITLGSNCDEHIAEALAASLRGVAETGGKVRNLNDVLLPIDAAGLVKAYASDTESLDETRQQLPPAEDVDRRHARRSPLRGDAGKRWLKTAHCP
jgi:hypothetical protein